MAGRGDVYSQPRLGFAARTCAFRQKSDMTSAQKINETSTRSINRARKTGAVTHHRRRRPPRRPKSAPPSTQKFTAALGHSADWLH